jgi:AcrR family transcriptional regulator
MSRPTESETAARTAAFSPDHWLKYGNNPQPTVREQMTLLAIEEIIASGPVDFNAGNICIRLGIKNPMVNYYFGGRDGLIAEATMAAHDNWIDFMHSNLQVATGSPEQRLRSWIENDIDWSQRMAGMGVLINYPMASLAAQKIVIDKFQERMQRNFEFGLALVTTLVIDVRSGKVSPMDFTIDNYPKAKLLLNMSAFTAATSIAWSTHGLAVWSSGRHIATQQIENQPLAAMNKITTNLMVENHIKQIIKVAKGD